MEFRIAVDNTASVLLVLQKLYSMNQPLLEGVREFSPTILVLQGTTSPDTSAQKHMLGGLHELGWGVKRDEIQNGVPPAQRLRALTPSFHHV